MLQLARNLGRRPVFILQQTRSCQLSVRASVVDTVTPSWRPARTNDRCKRQAPVKMRPPSGMFSLLHAKSDDIGSRRAQVLWRLS